MANTRARKQISGSKSKSQSSSQGQNQTSSKSITAALDQPVQDPPYVAILPKDASTASRIVTIPISDRKNHAAPVRYFVDPDRGFYEFTKITNTRESKKSWLLTSDCEDSSKDLADDPIKDDAYVLSSPDLLVATPINSLFILLSIDGVVYPAKDEQNRSTYSTIDNRLWELKQKAPYLRALFEENPNAKLIDLLSSKLEAISDKDANGCDGVEYCLSVSKVSTELLRIAKRMVHAGLPASLENRFVQQALDTPEQIVKRERTPGRDAKNDCKLEVETLAPDDQILDEGLENVRQLLRIRVALCFVLSRYVRADLSREIQAHLSNPTNGSIDFQPLEQHLAAIEKSKVEAQALRSISDNISRKRGIMDDEEALERQEAKKRKKDEEDAKKKNMSQGVKKLLKADTSGMKKLSSFFTKHSPKVR